jgi:hypothetical protein
LLTQFTDNAAHIGGLAGGFAVAYVAGTPGAIRSPKEQIWRVIAWMCVLITAFCFLKMYLWFRLNAR